MRCTPKTSCSPAATRNSTAAWNSPAARISTGALTPCAAGSASDVELRLGDPAPEVLARSLLHLPAVHAVDLGGIEDREVVAPVVRGDALHEGLFRYAVLAHPARPAEGDHLDAADGVGDLGLARPRAAALGLHGLLNAAPPHLHGEEGPVRFPVRPVARALVVPLHELL